MPRRIIDGEAMWTSDRLATVDPAWCAIEYPWLLPLAMANGVFEANPRTIWARVYAAYRGDMSAQKVALVLEAFERSRLLFRWTHADGHVWGFWTGIDKPGRLPGPSRAGKHERTGPDVPRDQLLAFLGGDSSQAVENATERNGIQNIPDGFQKVPGFGLGIGSGLGTGSGVGRGIRAAGRRATAISPEYHPDSAHAALANQLGVDLEAEFEKFCDYHRANGKPQKDWDAALRNWLRNSVRFNSGGKTHGLTVAEQTRRNAAIALDRIERREHEAAHAASAGGAVGGSPEGEQP